MVCYHSVFQRHHHRNAAVDKGRGWRGEECKDEGGGRRRKLIKYEDKKKSDGCMRFLYEGEGMIMAKEGGRTQRMGEGEGVRMEGGRRGEKESRKVGEIEVERTSKEEEGEKKKKQTKRRWIGKEGRKGILKRKWRLLTTRLVGVRI